MYIIIFFRPKCICICPWRLTASKVQGEHLEFSWIFLKFHLFPLTLNSLSSFRDRNPNTAGLSKQRKLIGSHRKKRTQDKLDLGTGEPELNKYHQVSISAHVGKMCPNSLIPLLLNVQPLQEGSMSLSLYLHLPFFLCHMSNPVSGGLNISHLPAHLEKHNIGS